MTSSDPVVVIGAGLAGLSAAIHLAAAGREVVVAEATRDPGGRCGTLRFGDYRFDTGPSVLTLPDVLRATVGAAGEELERWVELARLDPAYRLTFDDGSRLDIHADAARMCAEVERLAGPAEAARYARFRTRLVRLYHAEWGAFIARNYDGPRDLLQPLALLRLARLGAFRRLEPLVATHLDDWRVRRAHTFQSLYAGLSPFDALGIYGVIAYMDTVGGTWFPRRGGMHAVATALAGVAEKAGASLRYGATVERVEAGGGRVRAVVLAGGERIATSAAIVTADLPSAYRTMLPAAASDWRLRRRLRFAPSCLLLHLGIDRTLAGQAHHTVHLGADWRGTLEALCRRNEPQPDPSLLVSYPVAEDPDAAPNGHATLFVLEPTANVDGRADWAVLRRRLRARLLARLERLGYGDVEASTRAEVLVDPVAWQASGLSAGTPFSLAHTFSQTGWLRPANVCPTVAGLYFAGMGTVPGVGVPMVLISGRLAAERVLAGRAA